MNDDQQRFNHFKNTMEPVSIRHTYIYFYVFLFFSIFVNRSSLSEVFLARPISPCVIIILCSDIFQHNFHQLQGVQLTRLQTYMYQGLLLP